MLALLYGLICDASLKMSLPCVRTLFFFLTSWALKFCHKICILYVNVFECYHWETVLSVLSIANMAASDWCKETHLWVQAKNCGILWVYLESFSFDMKGMLSGNYGCAFLSQQNYLWCVVRRSESFLLGKPMTSISLLVGLPRCILTQMLFAVFLQSDVPNICLKHTGA